MDVEQVSDRVMNAARRFVRDVQKDGIRLQSAYLYGSYATGRARRGSDIDIALVSPDFTGWIDDLDKMQTAFRNRDPRIECVHFPPDAFVDENPLAWEVKTKGISLLQRRKPTTRAAKPHQASKRPTARKRATRSSRTAAASVRRNHS